MEYSKPPKTIEKQIELLKSKGLIVENEDRMGRYLGNISYYHFSIYFKHFKRGGVFIEGTTFEEVLNIYVFDQKLRLLLLDVLERIEKSFKCKLAYELSLIHKDPCWIADKLYFDSEQDYEDKIKKILDKLKFSKEACIKHYYGKYDSPKYPPIWMVLETLAFGQSVMVYRSLKKEYQRLVADSYGINKKFVSNWMFALSAVRNFCAHYSRLWNREMFVILDQKHGLYKNLFNNSNGNRLFNHLIVMQIINSKFNPKSRWVERLENIINEHKINVSHMGFPDDWRQRLQKIKEIEESRLKMTQKI